MQINYIKYKRAFHKTKFQLPSLIGTRNMKLIAALFLSLVASESHLASKKANEVLKNLFNITYTETHNGAVFSNAYGDLKIKKGVEWGDSYWVLIADMFPPKTKCICKKYSKDGEWFCEIFITVTEYSQLNNNIVNMILGHNETQLKTVEGFESVWSQILIKLDLTHTVGQN